MNDWASYLARGNYNSTPAALDELQETKKLLALATTPSVKSLLEKHLELLETKSKVQQIKIQPDISKNASSAVKPVEVKKSEGPPDSSVIPAKRKVVPTTGKYIPIEDFAWDQDGYSSPIVTVYIDLPGVGKAKQNCDIHFTKMSFDFTVTDLDGKNYRLLKDNLEKDIIPEQSKMVVKANRVILKLQKVKGEYSYENWNNLTAKKPRDPTAAADKKKDPMGGIMDMMKDMYDEGDENMKKIIGEAMLKSQRGEKNKPPSPSGMGDMPGMDDF